ncbi:MAG: replicative DNA helicase [Bacteroidales bacterium]|nr:replicative DNA helicase [Bacteroidales bacterium]MCL2738162.1 replicative DNA helicase [Bacteroidales bacterium]
MTNTVKKEKGRQKKETNIDLLGLDMGKKPPQALDIEEAVLGALMLEAGAVTDIMGILVAECFYKEANRKIFTAIKTLADRHAPVDIFTVAEELKKEQLLDEVGGPFYLSQLSNRVGAAAHIDYHTKILLQKYIQRELISISYEVQRDSFDDSIQVDDLLDTAQQKLFMLSDRRLRSDTMPVKTVLDQAIEDLQAAQLRQDGLSGIPSGFTSLDRVTLGWQASDLVIIAARPSMGKTAFVLTMARNMSVEHKIPVAFFSLEMAPLQLIRRLMVSETGLESDKIRGGKKLQSYEWAQLNTRINDLYHAPLYIDSTPALSIYEFRSKARRLVSLNGVKIIVIDYLQLMTGPPELRSMREQEVSAISRSLKAIAKELNVPIIALSQMNRSVETRGGSSRRPQLSDLRESGAIEQDADIVAFIHRPEYYGIFQDEKGNSLIGVADLIIAKHRNGEAKDIPMHFRSAQAKFLDMNDQELHSVNNPSQTYGSKMNSQSITPNDDFE